VGAGEARIYSSDGMMTYSTASKEIRMRMPKRLHIASHERKLRDVRVDPQLRAMLDNFVDKKTYQKTSRMWIYLMYAHVRRLAEFSRENFFHHVGKNYCLRFMDLDRVPPAMLAKIDDSAIAPSLLLTKQEHLTLTQSYLYNLVTVLMYRYIRDTYGPTILQGWGEVDVDYKVPIEGSQYSQDVLQSVMETTWIERDVPLKNAVVLEVGAGYGRIPHLLFSCSKIRKYIIVDIPPALYVSHYFLSSVLNDKRIFAFRPFTNFSAVREEFERADLAFLMPDQLALLPDGIADVCIGINCFQEMIREQVHEYFDQFDRLAKNVYLKAADQPHNVYTEDFIPFREYPFKPHWIRLSEQSCPLPLGYSEVLLRNEAAHHAR
jgi:hypothetical protein